MKLIESSAGKDCELPAVESCALEEGEDDAEDRVVFQKGGKVKKGIFNKFKRKNQNDEITLMTVPEDS